MIGVCRHTIYQWVRTGKFPEPVKLGPRASAWRVEDIERWIAERPTKKRGSHAANLGSVPPLLPNESGGTQQKYAKQKRQRG
ncbi:MAG: hypothetical protein KatS3mg038_3620 [Candidatus Kapaibacterium sp.]|nr:MAG: hypothetical protein KatS3mg038_3620 [Candidatus Kapabacteria bacterium]